MLNQEEITYIVALIDDLETDLRNSNLPASSKLICSLANFLSKKQPLGWLMLANFISDHLGVVEIRLALLHLMPEVKELIDPYRPDQEAETAC